MIWYKFSKPRNVVLNVKHEQGQAGIEEDVVLSLPAIIGETGIVGIAQMTLSCSERSALMKTTKVVLEVQNGVEL